MYQKPVKSVHVALQQQIRAIQPEESPEVAIFKRLMATLGLNQQRLKELLELHPDPIIEEMTIREIEEWALGGMLPVVQSSKKALLGHSIRLLSRISIEAEEITTLSKDIGFLSTLERLKPGANILQLCAGDRAFTLHVQHMIGPDAPQELINEAIWNYFWIVPNLEQAISYNAIAELLQDPDADWIEFFEAVVGDRLEPVPTKEEILTKMKKINREPIDYDGQYFDRAH